MSKIARIGNLTIGGGNKIAVQSMCNIKTSIADEVIRQIIDLENIGCDIIRVSVNKDKPGEYRLGKERRRSSKSP